MIYCNLDSERAVTLSVQGLFSASCADPGADFYSARNNPLNVVPKSSATVSQNFVSAGQDEWFGTGRLDGHESVLMAPITCCAAVLFYDEEMNLIGAGHAGGGVIDNNTLDTIKSTIDIANVCYIVYATPTFEYNTEEYAGYVAKLLDLCDTGRICIIDGFGKNGNMAMADMKGNLVLG